FGNRIGIEAVKPVVRAIPIRCGDTLSTETAVMPVGRSIGRKLETGRSKGFDVHSDWFPGKPCNHDHVSRTRVHIIAQRRDWDFLVWILAGSLRVGRKSLDGGAGTIEHEQIVIVGSGA